jgi:hypothetical protein
MNMRQNLAREGLEEIGENNQITGQPGSIRRVWSHLRSRVCGLVGGGELNLGRRSAICAVKEAHELGAADGRENLRTPDRMIFTCQQFTWGQSEIDRRVGGG